MASPDTHWETGALWPWRSRIQDSISRVLLFSVSNVKEQEGCASIVEMVSACQLLLPVSLSWAQL